MHPAPLLFAVGEVPAIFEIDVITPNDSKGRYSSKAILIFDKLLISRAGDKLLRLQYLGLLDI